MAVSSMMVFNSYLYIFTLGHFDNQVPFRQMGNLAEYLLHKGFIICFSMSSY